MATRRERMTVAPRAAWPSLLATVILVAVAVWLAWQRGGYFPPAFLAAGAVAFVATAVVLVAWPPRPAPGRAALIAVAAVLGLAAWMAVSAGWSPVPATAVEDGQRALAYAALLALAVLGAGAVGFRRYVPWVVLAVIVVVVGAGLLSRLLPDLISAPAPRPEAGFRLDYPLGYSNAYGALAAIGIVLGLGLSGDRQGRALPRALAAATIVPLGVAMYLSLSRGAWLALAAGLVILFLLARDRLALLATAVAAAAAAAVAILVLQDHPALIDGPRAGQALGTGGGGVLALTLGLALLVGAVQLAIVAAPVRVPRAAVVVVLGLVVLGGAAAVAVEHRRVGDFLDRQWNDFLRPAGQPSQSGRLATAKGPRSDFYRVALNGFEAEPWRGIGSGGFEPLYVRDRRTNETARDVHSLYLEVLGELGIVGALLLAAFVVATLAGVIAARGRPGPLGAGAAAAAGAAWTTWLVHAGVDWDWQMPALTAVALMLAGVVVATPPLPPPSAASAGSARPR
jgi:O-Antigen ligase